MGRAQTTPPGLPLTPWRHSCILRAAPSAPRAGRRPCSRLLPHTLEPRLSTCDHGDPRCDHLGVKQRLSLPLDHTVPEQGPAPHRTPGLGELKCSTMRHRRNYLGVKERAGRHSQTRTTQRGSELTPKGQGPGGEVRGPSQSSGTVPRASTALSVSTDQSALCNFCFLGTLTRC